MGKYIGVFLNSFWFIFFSCLQYFLIFVGIQFFYIYPILVVVLLILIIENNFYSLSRMNEEARAVARQGIIRSCVVMFRIVLVLWIFMGDMSFVWAICIAGSWSLYGIAQLYSLKTVNVLRDVFMIVIMCGLILLISISPRSSILALIGEYAHKIQETIDVWFSCIGVFIAYVVARLVFLRRRLKTELRGETCVPEVRDDAKFMMVIQYWFPENLSRDSLILSFVGGEEDVERYGMFFSRMLDDILDEKEDCLGMLETIEKIEKGELEEYEIGGNAFSSLRVNKDYAQVDIDGDDEWVDRPDSKFRFEEFKTAVQALVRFHELPYDRYNTLEVELFEGQAFRYSE
jgi:hypothetical protein